MRADSSALGLGAGLLAALCAGGCLNLSTQRWPGPMRAASKSLPAGDAVEHAAGPEEVTLLRHADPVSYRPAGTLSGIPMAFFDKTQRLTAGGAVIVAPGGLAEVVWSDGSSISLSGYGIGWVASPSRGEPLFELQEVTRARIALGKPGQVRLVGGSILRGSSGPYLLERQTQNTLLVHNQSKGNVFLEYRDTSFELGPGQVLELPLLEHGAAPLAVDPQLRKDPRWNDVWFSGGVELSPEGQGAFRAQLRAPAGALAELQAESELVARGVRLRLEPLASARFAPLTTSAPDAADGTGPKPRAAPPEPSPQGPAPAPPTQPAPAPAPAEVGAGTPKP